MKEQLYLIIQRDFVLSLFSTFGRREKLLNLLKINKFFIISANIVFVMLLIDFIVFSNALRSAIEMFIMCNLAMLISSQYTKRKSLLKIYESNYEFSIDEKLFHLNQILGAKRIERLFSSFRKEKISTSVRFELSKIQPAISTTDKNEDHCSSLINFVDYEKEKLFGTEAQLSNAKYDDVLTYLNVDKVSLTSKYYYL